jgi:hypothetical protein
MSNAIYVPKLRMLDIFVAREVGSDIPVVI